MACNEKAFVFFPMLLRGFIGSQIVKIIPNSAFCYLKLL